MFCMTQEGLRREGKNQTHLDFCLSSATCKLFVLRRVA